MSIRPEIDGNRVQKAIDLVPAERVLGHALGASHYSMHLEDLLFEYQVVHMMLQWSQLTATWSNVASLREADGDGAHQ